jgi:hypothetical protein
MDIIIKDIGTAASLWESTDIRTNYDGRTVIVGWRVSKKGTSESWCWWKADNEFCV